MALLALCRYKAPTLGPIGSKITAFWNLNEASGTRYDSIVATASDMTEAVLAVPTRTGPRGGSDVAASFSGSSSKFLKATTNVNSGQKMDIPSGGGDHCFFGWFYVTSTSGNQFLMARWDASSSSNLSYDLTIQSGTIYGQNGGTAYCSASQSAPTTSAWHFFVVWRDSADGKVRLQIDNGTVNVSASASNPSSRTQSVGIGAVPTTEFPMTGGMSRVGWIKGAILTSTERTALYNGGPSGALSWSDILAGGL